MQFGSITPGSKKGQICSTRSRIRKNSEPESADFSLELQGAIVRIYSGKITRHTTVRQLIHAWAFCSFSEEASRRDRDRRLDGPHPAATGALLEVFAPHAQSPPKQRASG